MFNVTYSYFDEKAHAWDTMTEIVNYERMCQLVREVAYGPKHVVVHTFSRAVISRQ